MRLPAAPAPSPAPAPQHWLLDPPHLIANFSVTSHFQLFEAASCVFVLRNARGCGGGGGGGWSVCSVVTEECHEGVTRDKCLVEVQQMLTTAL
jgi:hypothetical protein